MARKKMSKLEKAFYKRHPRANVEPELQLRLKAIAAKSAKPRKASDRFLPMLHKYSQGQVGAGSQDQFFRVLSRMRWVGSNGKITATGRKALRRYRNRVLNAPARVMFGRRKKS
jgi:hypothetical protein